MILGMLFILILLYYDKSVQKNLTAVAVRGHLFKEAVEQVFVLLPDFWVDAVRHAGTFYGALDDPGILQLLEMLRRSGLGEAQFFHQAARDARILLDQVLQDGNAGGMSDRLGHIRDVILLPCEQIRFCRSHIAILRLIGFDANFLFSIAFFV